MSRIFVLLLAILLAPSSWAACSGPSAFKALPAETQADLRARAATTPNANGVLWQIEKNGVTSYLVGTIHIPDKGLQTYVERISPLMQQTERFIMEITVEDEGRFEKRLMSDPSIYMLENGGSLVELLGEPLWGEVKVKLLEVGMPHFMAARYQPWFLSLSLAVPPCMLKAVQAGQLGLDRQLEKIARDMALERHSLDNIENLITLLSGEPIEVQITNMKEAIAAGMLDQKADAATVLDMYFNEEIQLIWTHTEYETEMAATRRGAGASGIAAQLTELENSLVISRNLDWVETLAQVLTQTPSTVAVGALHLPGEQGLLALLKARGFSIKRLSLRLD